MFVLKTCWAEGTSLQPKTCSSDRTCQSRQCTSTRASYRAYTSQLRADYSKIKCCEALVWKMNSYGKALIQ